MIYNGADRGISYICNLYHIKFNSRFPDLMSNFVHIQNHTHYSLLDSLLTVEELVDSAVKDGHKAVAITDLGVMFGGLDFYKKCRSKGIKPLIGMDAYFTDGSRFDKQAKKGKGRNFYRLLLLAKDMQGYKNLMKLTTLAHTEGFYYKPRIDCELLEKHKDGLICTSSSTAGIIGWNLVNGFNEDAERWVKYYHGLFGDDFYLQLQNHFLQNDDIILKKIPELAARHNIKTVASNDVYYLKKEHAVAHNVLLYIRDINASNAGSIDINNLRFGNDEFYFKSAAEMEKLFAEFPGALANTLEIADKCDVSLDTKTNYMPLFPVPASSSASDLDGYLKELVFEGLAARYEEITPEIKERAEYELEVICKMGFPGYFLIVWDFIKAAREMGCRVGPGRGSAAGSIVAYALEITNVDPLEYELLFERFLNPERVSMPDIDIDFADNKREMVIDYVKHKYGQEAVSMIITFGTLSSKAVLTDVGRVLGVNLDFIKQITKKIPVVFGKVTPLKEAVELPEIKMIIESESLHGKEKIKNFIDYSLLLEGKFRSVGTHAAGVVIAPEDLTNFVPLYKPAKLKENTSISIATQYNMKNLEDAGLLKMDFLGLRTLSIIENTLDMMESNHGIKVDIDKIDLADEKTYDLFSSGNTLAIFQFESSGMQEYMRQLKPRNLEEITAMNALYRPGPMENIPDFIKRKFGKQQVEYLHPVMEKSLKNTYGIIVYQEQVMQLVQDIAGYNLGQADLLRRAMGKKDVKQMEEQKVPFREGAARNGINEKLASEIFDLIVKFANYGFNKSHSLAYSYLAFQTAWLKANYTAEFLAANMSAELNDQAKIVQLIDEAKKNKIKVLPPDVNRSQATFYAVNSPDGDVIYFGMAAIKNIGIPAVENIVRAREEKPFTSIFDFCTRVDTRLINKRAIEALICSGAFDTLHPGRRAALYQSVDILLDYARIESENLEKGMDSLFLGGEDDSIKAEPLLPETEEWNELHKLAKEKEFLNFYVSGHPLVKYEPYVMSFTVFDSGYQPKYPENFSMLKEMEKREIRERNRIALCGIITDIRTRLDKNNRPIAFVMLEDFKGKTECIFWSDSYQKFSNLVSLDSLIFIEGIANPGEDSLKVVADNVMALDEVMEKRAKGYRIWIDKNDGSALAALERMKEGLARDGQKGGEILFNIFEDPSGKAFATYKTDGLGVAITKENYEFLYAIFGPKRLRFML